MPRIARIIAAGYPHHITQCGNNRATVFFDGEDRQTNLKLLNKKGVSLIPVIFLWLLPMVLLFSHGVSAGMLGIYGVDKDWRVFSQYSVDAVFVPPKVELIAAQKAAGRNVFLTLNAFGGSGGWKDFPDARPVKADGEYLEPALGGICPTHEGWRRSRLDLLTSWLETYSGTSAIDGIWLDFIRYPGRWEQGNPDIPDTCYCPRCLGKFQRMFPFEK